MLLGEDRSCSLMTESQSINIHIHTDVNYTCTCHFYAECKMTLYIVKEHVVRIETGIIFHIPF